MNSPPDIRTPDGFLRLLQTGTPEAIVDAVADFTDADRRKLSKTIQDYAKTLRKEDPEAITENRFDRVNVALATAQLGLLAVAPKSANMVALPSVLRAKQAWETIEPTAHESAAISILLSRRPDWAQSWLERQLQTTDFGSMLRWPSVSRLLKSELCTVPDTEECAQFMQVILKQNNLRDVPDLIDFVWLQFRHSAGFFQLYGKLRTITRELRRGVSLHGVEWLWHQTHLGLIDRGRLIDEILGALGRDFDGQERAALVKLHEALDVTPEELVSRQAEYRGLLTHEATATVTFVLKCLKSMKAAEGFDGDAAMTELPAVFNLTTKAQPKSALVLLKSLVSKDKARIEAASEIAAQALQHSEVDVQEAAIKILEQWAKVHVPVERLKQAGESVFPTVRSRIDALLQFAGVATEEDKAPIGDEQRGPTAEELFRQIEECSPELRKAWKLDESLTAAVGHRMLPIVDVNAIPLELDSLSTVDRIESVDELISEIALLVENIESPLQLERILDSISRLGLDYPADFDVRVAPTIKRVEGETDSESWTTLASTFPMTAGLIVDWLSQKIHLSSNGPVVSAGRPGDKPNDIAQTLDVRASELRQRFPGCRNGLPLLSLPTHEHGWIESGELLKRLREYSRAAEDPGDADLRFALLRLAPSPEFSKDQLSGLPEKQARLLRYVAGGDAEIRAADCPGLWLAAARTRDPRGELPNCFRIRELPGAAWGLQSATIGFYPENSPPAREAELWGKPKAQDPNKQLTVSERLAQAKARIRANAELKAQERSTTHLVQIKPEPSQSDLRFPTVVFAARASVTKRVSEGFSNDWLPGWADRWQALHWPSNSDGILAMSAGYLLCRMDSNTSSWEPSAPALQPLLWPEHGWSEIGITAMWLAMFSKDGDARGVAVDAMIEGLLDGRAHPEPLATVLVELLANRWLKLNRLADALSEVSRVSTWSSLVVSVMIDAAIVSWIEAPRDAHHLLTVQLATLIQLDGGLSAEAKLPLQKLSGSSKTTKLAKQLLALPGSRQSVLWKSALLEGAECRIRRATTSDSN